ARRGGGPPRRGCRPPRPAPPPPPPRPGRPPHATRRPRPARLHHPPPHHPLNPVAGTPSPGSEDPDDRSTWGLSTPPLRHRSPGDTLNFRVARHPPEPASLL